MVRIANPIYDVVFKYLMSDNRIAKLLISAIIGEEIIDLEFRPTEYRTELKAHSLLVYRLDFAAKIAQPDGSEKLVLIEIQKAKYPRDIMRFRRYLGNQYADSNNRIIKEENDPYNALPIITIYFLGHKLDHTTAPIIKVRREYIDVVSGNIINEREPFIESLTHDSFIIQIPFLSKKRQTEIEAILAVFDQSGMIDDAHFLDIDDENYPEKYRDVIRRLLMAAAEVKIRQTMTVEDEILSELDALEYKLRKIEEDIEEKEQVLENKEQVIEEKEQVIKQVTEEKDSQLANAVNILAEKLAIPPEEARRMITGG